VCREHGAALLLVSHDEMTLADFEGVRDFREINVPMAQKLQAPTSKLQ